ncbi:hypothetical protein T440DRAFT_489486 [Plenodomus tracheiphilus IPT5]|uniref:Uncharacterized protein n=1 Tax=Plenodomus tracheiphilus IPT5 TaxID=1408161 RepID=A0A6A7B5M3_9PLEO|nr:hypothetical protein T440DRAFT_489486 [Plenodomus tracheiphilus IPT5]
MASALDSNRQGAIHLDGAVYDKVLREQGIDKVTKKDRNKLKERVKKARKLFQICQEFDLGLLCLLLFIEISENQLYNMTTAEINEFHILADGKKLEIAGRCEIGITWPKPPSWPWEWPMDPTWAPLDACELSSLEECTYLSELL